MSMLPDIDTRGYLVRRAQDGWQIVNRFSVPVADEPTHESYESARRRADELNDHVIRSRFA